MNEHEVRERAFAMPLTSPAYPIGPYRFYHREFLIITYRTDARKLRELVPEPLEIDEPLVKYEFIRMPDSTGFGDYTESGQVIPVSFEGRKGGYSHCMFLNDHPPIAGGRELSSYPDRCTLQVERRTLPGEPEGVLASEVETLLAGLGAADPTFSGKARPLFSRPPYEIDEMPPLPGILATAARIALTHHERWDGTGYPQGLAGSFIPIEGRIAAVADVFDVLVNPSVYRTQLQIGPALGVMRDGRGTQFDPDVVDAFLEHVADAIGVPHSPAFVTLGPRAP